MAEVDKCWSHERGETLLAKVEGHLNDADQKKHVYVKQPCAKWETLKQFRGV